jgi:hypothetical protein
MCSAAYVDVSVSPLGKYLLRVREGERERQRQRERQREGERGERERQRQRDEAREFPHAFPLSSYAIGHPEIVDTPMVTPRSSLGLLG